MNLDTEIGVLGCKWSRQSGSLQLSSLGLGRAFGSFADVNEFAKGQCLDEPSAVFCVLS